MEMSVSRRQAIGLTVGALWLIVISAAFATFALVMVNTTIATATLIAMLVVVAALIAIGIGNIRAVLRLPGQLPPRTSTEQRLVRQFRWVVAAEVVAILVVNGILGATNRIILIPSLDLMIVGIHFFPLAHLFGVRRYYPTGLLFCAIPAFMFVAVPDTTRMGHVQAWWVLPSLGCGLVAFVAAAASLREVRQFLGSSVTVVQPT
jgi:hypothetical protein